MKTSIVLMLCFSVFVSELESHPQLSTHLNYMNASWKVLFEAMISGNENVVRELLKNVEYVKLTDEEGNTPIIVAAGNGNESIVELLIQKNANVNIANNIGETALMTAAISGYESIVKLLIQNGANMNAVDVFNETALTKAADFEHWNILHLLIQSGANISPNDAFFKRAMLWAAKDGYDKTVEILIQNGVNVNYADEIGDTPIMLAAKKGHVNVVQLLLKAGANVNHVNRHDDTILIYAAMGGDKFIMNRILQKYLNIDAQNYRGETALHAAAFAGREDAVRVLINYGAKCNIMNNRFQIAKDSALEKGHMKIVDMLRASTRACNLYSNFLTGRNIDDNVIKSSDYNRMDYYPWMVAIGYMNAQYHVTFDCGGTLISDSFVLTAAHCVTDHHRPNVVRLGKASLRDTSGTNAENQNIKEIIKHPKYRPTKKKNDIALIRFVQRIYFSETISPACLQIDLRDEDPATVVTVTGWGIASMEWRNRSSEMRIVDLHTMPLAQCNQTILEYNEDKNLAAYRNGISESQYCAHDPNGVKDSCEGDSGGPLQIGSKVIGIVSFSIGSCGSPMPGIYTRVAFYIDWIASYVWPDNEITPPLRNEADDVLFRI